MCLVNDTETSRPQAVWLLAGQSNMIGFGPKGSELSPEWWTSRPNVSTYTVDAWAPLLPTEGSFGPEIGFGHAMAGAHPGTDFLLIKPLFGLGNLYEDWRSPNAGRGAEGPHYRALMDLVKQALADRPLARIVGMLWMQGEGDAHNDLIKALAYERNLTLFIQSVRDDLGVPDMAFLFGQITTSPTWIHHAIVREAQEKVAGSVARTAMFDTDDLPLWDGIHYNTAGSLELGLRFFHAAMGLELRG